MDKFDNKVGIIYLVLIHILGIVTIIAGMIVKIWFWQVIGWITVTMALIVTLLIKKNINDKSNKKEVLKSGK